MKLPLIASTALFVVASFASAETLLLNFHSTNANDPGVVAGSYLTLSPAHSVGAVSSTTDTTWNNFSTTTTSSSLLNASGTAATGVSITFGQESFAGSGAIDYGLTTGINLTALYGNGGSAAGKQSFVGDPLSIYGSGNNTSNSAPGRAGWLGTGNATTGNTAIGMRIDGLQAGTYTIYVMGRNTNGNGNATPINFFAATGASSAAFDFSLLTPTQEGNPTYANTSPTAYNTFIAGENYVAMQVTITAGQSLFLASDGASATETRGFFNMVEIVPVPEGSTLSLLVVGLGLVVFRMRRVVSAR